jgi:hypothetical protein
MQSFFKFLLVTLMASLLLASSSRAQTTTQTVSLTTGWNAVWLEVEPRDATGDLKPPQDVFNDPAITTIATPKPLAGLAEFFGSDPGTISTFNQDQWLQWLKTDPSGSNNLPFIFGNRPYLIETSAPVNLAVSGKARFFRPTWTPDRYNLLGFGIEGTISFQDFFASASGKHPVSRIYRLAGNGNWSVVPPGDPLLDGVAYWIFSDGPSQFMGPVAVDFDLAALGTLNFGGPGDAVAVAGSAPDLDLEELVFTNLASTTATPTLELITTDGDPADLSLHVVHPTADHLGEETGAQVDATADDGPGPSLGESVAPSRTTILTLGADRNWSTLAVNRTNLYRLTAGNPGVQFWLPVTAAHNDLQLPTDLLPATEAGSVAGLWVGEVVVDAVTSIVEDGSPTQPTAGSAPIRILLHSDASGTVSLLSQVTIMQTKTADPEVDPIPVLVVDQARLPFFEGVKERNGKRVGLRLYAVAFDMPRKIDAITQDALLNDPAYPDLTVEEISNFLASRTLRPSSLVEDYALSWNLEGALGTGKTVKTSTDQPLRLDPFHRSNPFRHAFHQQHPNGPDIIRDLEIVFDPDQTIPDRLRGTFRETLQGVTTTKLELTGRLELRRVSSVNTLEGSD